MRPQASQQVMVPRVLFADIKPGHRIIMCAYHPVPAPSAGSSPGVVAGRGQTTLNPPPQAAVAVSAFLQEHGDMLAGFCTSPEMHLGYSKP